MHSILTLVCHYAYFSTMVHFNKQRCAKMSTTGLETSQALLPFTQIRQLLPNWSAGVCLSIKIFTLTFHVFPLFFQQSATNRLSIRDKIVKMLSQFVIDSTNEPVDYRVAQNLSIFSKFITDHY